MQLPKPFLLLAGISGTGKTRFVRKQAAKHNVGDINFCQIPVRPDWHEPSDLLGYISRISGTKYIATKALKFIIDAWRVVAPNADKEGMGELDLSVAPYWLCLDEMNLAPVEQYFADYLSVLESRKFENGKYTCEPLLTQSNFQMDINSLRTDLGISDDEDGLWEYFSHHGIPLPPNLIVAGTVNMDETTHGFSRKVIDRAFTLDFGEFFPNDYQKFFTEQDEPKVFTYSQLTHATKNDLSNTGDVDGSKTVAFLESINDVLKHTPFELAYRALNELLLHVACFNPQDDKELHAVWDDFLMTKVLPRIDGDEDKLRLVRPSGPVNLLDTLAEVLKSNMSKIWAEGKTRKDFFRNTHDDKQIDNIECRSRKKIEWMKNRLEANTFTSFWP
ncbi:restriction endonuclease [Paraglaciecola sp. MB-3u-78]|nr:restriction endonuclease [Paraglaciecola sp. MB-3u-78]